MKKHTKNCAYSCNKRCDCDGYHTFKELYEHRITLYIALCRVMANIDWNNQNIWRSKKHSDGKIIFKGNWFVLGIGKKAETQISYHIPINRWDDTGFAQTLNKAPKFDGHTSEDVLNRLNEKIF